MTDIVTGYEVAARDGLQAQSVEITLEQRRQPIEALAKANAPELEIGSFVSLEAKRRWRERTSWREHCPSQELFSAPAQYEGLRTRAP